MHFSFRSLQKSFCLIVPSRWFGRFSWNFYCGTSARIWCLASLGKFWNTKIIILPGADVVRKGPYKWIRHPNYLIVTTELLVLPLLFGAYFTAIIFAFLNVWMLSVRIPAEEKALKEATNYRGEVFIEMNG